MPFISSAYAQDASESAAPAGDAANITLQSPQDEGAGQPPSGAPSWTGIVPLLAVFLVFYFLVIRPQNKRFKKHQEMQQSIKKGDRIVTSGGIIGKVARVKDDGVLHVEIAENTVIQLEREGISRLFARQDDSA